MLVVQQITLKWYFNLILHKEIKISHKVILNLHSHNNKFHKHNNSIKEFHLVKVAIYKINKLYIKEDQNLCNNNHNHL